MMRVCLLVLALGLLVLCTVGCEYTAHDRYREMQFRRIRKVDDNGIKDDWNAVWYEQQPTRLSPWFQP